MASKGKFDTDFEALKVRISSHEHYGTYDINEWILNNLDLVKGLSILDLGCGSGKQTIPIAKTIGHSGNIISADISSEALAFLRDTAVTEALTQQISTMCCDLDGIGTQLSHLTFDRILSSFSLYYAQEPYALFGTIWDLLNLGGIFFFCGPARDNNKELRDFHFGLADGQSPPDASASIFMEDSGLRFAKETFSTVEISRFENPLRFGSTESLYDYWSSYNLYDSELAEAFSLAAVRHFQNHSVFETTKRVVGITATKG